MAIPYGALVQIKKGPFAGHRGYAVDCAGSFGLFGHKSMYRLTPENKSVRNYLGFDRFSEMYFDESNLRIISSK